MPSGTKVTTFKERLCDIIEKSPKADTDIARELGTSKQTLSAWKCGTRSPKEPTIRAIAAYFGVGVDWLMGFDVDPYGSSDENIDCRPVSDADIRFALSNGDQPITDAQFEEVKKFVEFIQTRDKK